jgi:ATP-dependent RNA helicase RhlE
MRLALIFGGVNERPQIDSLRRGAEIVVATPGRLLDLMNQGYVNLTGIEVLVLDEADRMLDMGFINDIRKIVGKLPPRRQTILFSATMPAPIRQLAQTLMHDPATVQISPPASAAAAKIDESVYFVERQNKPQLLAHLVGHLPMTRAIVFTRTKHGADRVVKKLVQSGIRANAIHGNKSQPQREKALGEFRRGDVKILVATDIAARGIDVSGVSHVINFELPNVPEQYVHRIGRTARAGAAGVAISLCAPDEKAYLRDIWKLTKANLEEIGLPEGLAAEARKVNARVPGEAQAERQERREHSAEQRRRFPPRKKAQVQAKARGEGGQHAHGQNAGSQPTRAQKSSGGNASGNRRRFNKQRRNAG